MDADHQLESRPGWLSLKLIMSWEQLCSLLKMGWGVQKAFHYPKVRGDYCWRRNTM